MKEDFVILKEKIADADMVLVGIGEEFGSTEKQICESGKYQAVFPGYLQKMNGCCHIFILK